MLMLSAEIDPLDGGGPTPAPVPPGGTVVPTPGPLVLQDRKAAGAAAAGTPRKPKRLGTARFSIAAGKKQTVKIKLNAAGRRLARHKRRLTAYAVATVGDQTVTTKVTLEAPRH